MTTTTTNKTAGTDTTWCCFTCRHIYNSCRERGLPAEDEAVYNEDDIPIVIHYQCYPCADYATKHCIEYMTFAEQMDFRDFEEDE